MLDQTLLNEFQGRELEQVNWHSPEEFFKLAQSGIYVPFGDAFEYKGRGFLLIGQPGSGKTSITGRFVRYNNRHSKRLSQDSSTNRFDGVNNLVYQTNSGIYVDLMPLKIGATDYRISTIFHLLDVEGEIRQGDLELALIQMFWYPIHFSEDLQSQKSKIHRPLIEITSKAYERIPVLTLPFDENPDTRYRKLKEVVAS